LSSREVHQDICQDRARAGLRLDSLSGLQSRQRRLFAVQPDMRPRVNRSPPPASCRAARVAAGFRYRNRAGNSGRIEAAWFWPVPASTCLFAKISAFLLLPSLRLPYCADRLMIDVVSASFAAGSVQSLPHKQRGSRFRPHGCPPRPARRRSHRH